MMLTNLTAIILSCLAITLTSPAARAQAPGQPGKIDPEIERILRQLESDDGDQEKSAETTLVRLGKDAAPPLIEILKTTEDERTFESVGRALLVVGIDAVPGLIEALKVEAARPTAGVLALRRISNVLASIAEGLRDYAPNLTEAVPPLMKIIDKGRGRHQAAMERFTHSRTLTKKDIDEINYGLQDFDAATHCLGRIGRAAKDAVPLLMEVLASERHRKYGYDKADSIKLILADLIRTSDFSANEIIDRSFEKHKNELRERDRWQIENSINILKRQREAQDYNLKNIIVRHGSLLGILALILFVASVWLSIFLVRPIWLLKFYEVFPGGEARVPGVWMTLSVAAHHLLAPLVFRTRVLDAWVKRHLPKAHLNFSNKHTVSDRRVYVPIGVFLDGKPLSKLTPQDLRATFGRNQSRLLISGVGGAGKTSLACQVAKWAMEDEPGGRLCPEHRMIPVLLEQDFVEGGDDALKKAIVAQCGDMIDADAPISDALLEALLKRKRMLLIVDGMSEMSEETRKAILSGITRIPTNAVVFTSRGEEAISELSKTVVKPTKITGNKLSTFVETYLTSLGGKELFEDEEFFEGCRLLSTMVDDREITALLATLFVEQMVARQEKTVAANLPQNIPELMKQSIERLYAKTPSGALALREVIKSAKVIAWECLRKEYRPLPANYEEVKKSLADVPNGEKALDYLKDRLQLIETAFFDEKIRFKIDPLAEYLAGMYLVEENGGNKNRWRKFFETASAKAGSPENITGFLLAVRDCCTAEGAENGVPGFVTEELTELTRTDGKRRTGPGGRD
jgi:hypothetical protein